MQRLSTALAIAIIAAATGAEAQDGTKHSFGLSSTLRYDDNWRFEPTPPDASVQFMNQLSYGISSETRTQKAEIAAGVSLHATRLGGEEETQTGAADPYLRASYRREGATSLFSANGRIARDDRNIGRSDDNGSAIKGSARVALSFGRGLPFGGDLETSYDSTTYDDAAGEDDTRTTRARAAFSLAVSPAVSLRPGATFTRYEVDDLDSSQTDTTVVSLGVRMRLSPTDTLDARASGTRIEAASGATAEGTNWSLGYRHEGQAVTTAITLATALSFAGERKSLNLSREHDLADATLRYGLGVTRNSGEEDQVTANLTWRQQLRTASYDVTLKRAVATDDEGEETLKTDVSAKYTRELSEVSRITVLARYDAEDVTGGDSTQEASAGLRYGHSLGEDWQLSAGLEHRVKDDADDIRSTSNSVFLTFERTWTAYR